MSNRFFKTPVGLPPPMRRAALPEQYVDDNHLSEDSERIVGKVTAELRSGEYQMIDCPTPLVIPADWHEHERSRTNARFQCKKSGLRVALSACRERDGKRWLHVSLSYPSRMPSYDDMTRVKNLFIGTEKTALQVFPPKSQHVNLHNFVLHLWHCLDGDVTPDFRKGGGL